jgi:hypothetical protein
MPLKEGHIIPPRKATSSWNIPINSLINHLNGKTRFKNMGSKGVLIKGKDAKLITWT